MINSKCPACRQALSLHEESIAISAEVLCAECGAVLSIVKRDPLLLKEVNPDPDDLAS